MTNKACLLSDELPDMLTVNEVSRILRRGKNQTYRLVEEEGLGIRIGRAIRVPKANLEAWLQAKICESEADDHICGFSYLSPHRAYVWSPN